MIELTPLVRTLDLPWGRYLSDPIHVDVVFPQGDAVSAYTGMIDHFTRIYQERKQKSKTCTQRSFHINGGTEEAQLREAFCKIAYETGIHTTLNFLGTYSKPRIEVIKYKDIWMTGVDGTGNVNTANMRAWNNRVSMFGSLGIITANCHSPVNAANSLAFAMMNLNVNGFTYVMFDTWSPGLLALIHIASMCFTSSKIRRENDRYMFIGERFIGLRKKFHRYLYDLCENNHDVPEMIPFDPEYFSADVWTYTMDCLNGV